MEFAYPYVANGTDESALAEAAVSDTTRWGLAHLAIAFGYALLALAFLAIRSYLREAGEEPWSSPALPLVVAAMRPSSPLAPARVARTRGVDGLSDVVGFVIGMLALGLGLAVFFLSLTRLHRRMVEVKRDELSVARALYAEAYGPVRATPTAETLEAQRNLLGAADGLEKRAQAIWEWPIGEGTLARVVTIATSVVAVTIARLLLDPFGL